MSSGASSSEDVDVCQQAQYEVIKTGQKASVLPEILTQLYAKNGQFVHRHASRPSANSGVGDIVDHRVMFAMYPKLNAESVPATYNQEYGGVQGAMTWDKLSSP